MCLWCPILCFLFCFQGDEKNDNWIFSLAVLLSSTMVYNSMGTIDNNALEKLQYPACLQRSTCSLAQLTHVYCFVILDKISPILKVFYHPMSQNGRYTTHKCIHTHPSLIRECFSFILSSTPPPAAMWLNWRSTSKWSLGMKMKMNPQNSCDSFPPSCGQFVTSPWSWSSMEEPSQQISTWRTPSSWNEVRETSRTWWFCEKGSFTFSTDTLQYITLSGSQMLSNIETLLALF